MSIQNLAYKKKTVYERADESVVSDAFAYSEDYKNILTAERPSARRSKFQLRWLNATAFENTNSEIK